MVRKTTITLSESNQQGAQDVHCSDKKQYACSKQSCGRSTTRLLREETSEYRAVGRGAGDGTDAAH